MINIRINIAEGANASASVRDTAAIVRKTLDIVNVAKNENKTNMKNAPGSRRKLLMKYSVKLNNMATRTFNGKPHIMEDRASATGWYRANFLCFSTIGRWAYRVRICIYLSARRKQYRSR